MNRKNAEQPIAVPAPELLELIHTQRGHMSPALRTKGAESLVAVWRSRRGHVRPPRPLAAWAIAGAVVCLGIVTFVYNKLNGSTLSYAVDGGQIGHEGDIDSSPMGAPRLRFSDGSEVQLGAGAKASLRSVGAHGARVSLGGGRAHVEIMHVPGARWFVDAGPFVIAVTGTAFTVDWHADQEQLDVQMERGTVEVTGPFSEAPVVVRSRQHLTMRARQRDVLVTDGEPVANSPETPAPAPEPRSAAELPAPGREASGKSGAGVRVRASSTAPSGSAALEKRNWTAKLASGEFDDIVREAEQIGVPTCLAESSSGDLAALADAARYSRHDDLARRALLAERHRFPLTAEARDAVFLLGRLEEADQKPSKAIEWYDQYLAETSSGTYASEALGRKMDLVARLYGEQEARAIADQYLSRFPHGTYAARARALSRGP